MELKSQLSSREVESRWGVGVGGSKGGKTERTEASGRVGAVGKLLGSAPCASRGRVGV